MHKISLFGKSRANLVMPAVSLHSIVTLFTSLSSAIVKKP